jgi:hypothetical protein
MRVRYRLGAGVAVVALLLTTVGIQTATASGPYVTRLRVEISGTSDWQYVRIANSYIASYHTATSSPGSIVERGADVIQLRGAGNQLVSATVDILAEVGDTSSFTITLAKGKIGESHVKLYRLNDSNPVQILSLNNYETSGDMKVASSVSRSVLVATGYVMPRVDPRRLVLAFYYPWFHEGSFSKGAWYDTPTGPYDTQDPDHVSQMVDQAKGAGVDGLIVSWDDVGDHTARFDLVMSELAKRSMHVSPVVELLAFRTSSGAFDVTKIVNTMKLALQRSSNLAFLKVGSRPVLWTYGAWEMDVATWTAIRGAVISAGYNPFFIGEPIGAEWALDGTYFYNPNGMSYDGIVWKYAGIKRELRYAAQVNPLVKQRLWAASVSPGQNMSYMNPLFPQGQERKDGERYDLTWSAAISSEPEWVLVTSWNEWYEATHVAPSAKFGSRALNQTAGWSSAFHNPQPWGGSQNQGGFLPIELPLQLGAKN